MKELLDKIPESGYITRSNHGQQMRGHTGYILYDAEVDSLFLHNHYFGSSVDQVHNLKTNSGKIDVRVHLSYPKYIQDFQKTLLNHHNAISFSAYVCTDKEDLGLSLNMPHYTNLMPKGIPHENMSFTCTAYYTGFKKLGHYDNISLIKAISLKLRACKAIIKENQNDLAFLDSVVCNNTNSVLELHASPLMLD